MLVQFLHQLGSKTTASSASQTRAHPHNQHELRAVYVHTGCELGSHVVCVSVCRVDVRACGPQLVMSGSQRASKQRAVETTWGLWAS